MNRPLNPYERWMLKQNIEHAVKEGAATVIARLHSQGYHRVANALDEIVKNGGDIDGQMLDSH